MHAHTHNVRTLRPARAPASITATLRLEGAACGSGGARDNAAVAAALVDAAALARRLRSLMDDARTRRAAGEAVPATATGATSTGAASAGSGVTGEAGLLSGVCVPTLLPSSTPAPFTSTVGVLGAAMLLGCNGGLRVPTIASPNSAAASASVFAFIQARNAHAHAHRHRRRHKAGRVGPEPRAGRGRHLGQDEAGVLVDSIDLADGADERGRAQRAAELL
jgi:hypothetical protein